MSNRSFRVKSITGLGSVGALAVVRSSQGLVGLMNWQLTRSTRPVPWPLVGYVSSTIARSGVLAIREVAVGVPTLVLVVGESVGLLNITASLNVSFMNGSKSVTNCTRSNAVAVLVKHSGVVATTVLVGMTASVGGELEVAAPASNE